jgi:predicted MFS family arabinose efflux permease
MTDSGNPSVVAWLGALLVGLGTPVWLAPSLIMPFAAQIIIGVGWAGVAPGGQTLVANLAPAHRRGEASGYYQAALRAGSAFIPSFGLWLLGVSNFTVVFMIVTVGGILAALSMSAVRVQSNAPDASRPRPSVGGLIDKGAMLPSTLIALFIITGSATSSFLPLFAEERGIDNVAIVFLVTGIIGLTAAATLGGLSDRIGRPVSVTLSFLAGIVGLLVLSQASNIYMLVLGGSAYSIGSATLLSALMAMVMDFSQPGRRGAAQATFAAAIQLGSTVGSLTTGLIIDLIGYSSLYYVCLIPMCVGLVVLGLNWRPTTAGHEPESLAQT